MATHMMDTPAAAEYLGLSRHTLDRWRWSGDGPAFSKLGNAVRYRLEDVDAFIAAGRRKNTSDSGAAA